MDRSIDRPPLAPERRALARAIAQQIAFLQAQLADILADRWEPAEDDATNDPGYHAWHQERGPGAAEVDRWREDRARR